MHRRRRIVPVAVGKPTKKGGVVMPLTMVVLVSTGADCENP